jgi:hypothetical protein
MDRFVSGRSVSVHRMKVAALCAMLFAASLCGCTVLSTLAYIVHDDNTPAEFSELAGKKIAVVCRPAFQLQYADSSAAPALAALVGEQLAKNVKKCTVVSPGQVAMWADSNNWDEYAEIGRAMKADMVVGIDLEQFSLYEGQTLYQGRADIHVWVYDMHTGGHTAIWNKKMPQTVWPPTAAVSVSDKSEDAFRREYLAVIADHISRYFYEHERLLEFATDAESLK